MKQIEELTPDLLIALLNKLKTGNDINFTIEPGRLSFVPFDVEPKRVLEPVVTSQAFPILIAGDALLSAEYRFGTGVTNGVNCANVLLDSIDPSLNVNSDYINHFYHSM